MCVFVLGEGKEAVEKRADPPALYSLVSIPDLVDFSFPRSPAGSKYRNTIGSEGYLPVRRAGIKDPLVSLSTKIHAIATKDLEA